MTARDATVVGWCPGVLRPMQSGDGLLLRVKPALGRLSLIDAATLAEAALRFGNGTLDLTSRGGLQIRGVTAATLPELTAVLDRLGLVDPDPGQEAARGLLANPLAGVDPQAKADIRPVVEAVAERWRTEAALHALPAKWSIVVDDGGQHSLREILADLRFEAEADDRLRIGLATAPQGASCRTAEAAEVASRLARLALIDGPHRMADLEAEHGAPALFRKAGLEPLPDPARPRPRTTPADLLGVHAIGGLAVAGVAAPFGGLDAAAALALTEVAQRCGADHLHLTPWRVLLVSGPAGWSAEPLLREATALGLIVTPGDRRLAVAVCVGAPACHRGTTAVRDHAAILAEALPGTAGLALHVSGCLKGCAHGGPAPVTLVGRAGRYDAVLSGRADDTPVRKDLSFQEAALWLSRLREGIAG